MSKVVVVGGGLAGISAALALADTGDFEVRLLEARGHLGGRVASVKDPRTGLMLDNCHHACFRVYDRFLQLLARAEVRSAVRMQARTKLTFTDLDRDVSGVLSDGRLSPPNHMLGSLLRFPHLRLRDKLRMRRAVKALASMTEEQRLALDDKPFLEWLKENGQTEAAISRFWGFFVLAALNIPVDMASTAQAAFLYQRGLFGDPHAFDVGGFSSDLSDALGSGLAEALEAAGVELSTSTKARSLLWQDGICCGVVTRQGEQEADIVVLAAPHHQTKELLASGPAAAQRVAADLAKMRFSALIGLHALYSEQVTPAEFHFSTLLDEPVIQMVFNRNRELGRAPGRGIAQWLSVPISYADPHLDTSDEEFERIYRERIDRLWPGHGDHLERFLVIKTPKATFAPFTGTQRLRPAADIGVSGLRLAGDFTDSKWPSTMEGAVTSGLLAAASILGMREWTADDLWAGWPEPPKRGDENWATF